MLVLSLQVMALQGVMSLPEEQASAQLIIERCAAHPLQLTMTSHCPAFSILIASNPANAGPGHNSNIAATCTLVAVDANCPALPCVASLLRLLGVLSRFSRYPAILARTPDALEAQLSGLADLLGCDLQRACES